MESESEITMFNLRRQARLFTRLKTKVIRNMSADDLKRELARAGHPEFLHVPAFTDSDGLDEWIAMIFDNNGDHSDNLLQDEDGKEFHGTLSECIAKVRDFAAGYPVMQLRIVIERVC